MWLKVVGDHFKIYAYNLFFGKSYVSKNQFPASYLALL